MEKKMTNISDNSEIKKDTLIMKVTVEATELEAVMVTDTLANHIEIKEEVEIAKLNSKTESKILMTSKQVAGFNLKLEAGDHKMKTYSADWMSKTKAMEINWQRESAAIRVDIEAEKLRIAKAPKLKAKMEAEDLRLRKKIAMKNAKKEKRYVHDIIGGGTRVMHLLRQFTFRYPACWPVRRVIAAAEEDAAAVEADTVTVEALDMVGLGVPDINFLKGLVSEFEPLSTTLEDVYQTVRWQWIRDMAETEERNINLSGDPDAPELQTKYKSDILEILDDSGMPEVYFQQILTELLKKVPGATIAQVRLHAFRSLLLMSQDGTVTINQCVEGVDSNFMVKHSG